MKKGKWKMENGKWKMENGKWIMENGKWPTGYPLNKQSLAHHKSKASKWKTAECIRTNGALKLSQKIVLKLCMTLV